MSTFYYIFENVWHVQQLCLYFYEIERLFFIYARLNSQRNSVVISSNEKQKIGLLIVWIVE